MARRAQSTGFMDAFASYSAARADSAAAVAEPEETPVAPEEWRAWLTTLFPRHFTSFADRHIQFWTHLWSIERTQPVRPFIGIWSRGGGKTTGAEGGATALGVRGKRRYGLYVKATQPQANQSVTTIARMLESPLIARYYPEHAERMVSKYGISRGWAGDRLRTADGLTIQAVGLDAAARGLKDDEQRPDFIVFDDIDGRHDSAKTTEDKIATITQSIMPAGSIDCAYIGIQNLIIEHGFFARIADGSADYLRNAIVSGPYPAVLGLQTERQWSEEYGRTIHAIVSGTATWEGQNLAICQKQIVEWGFPAFDREAQHNVKMRAEGRALSKYDPGVHDVSLSDDDVRRLVATGAPFAGVDFQLWRFAFVLFVANGKPGAERITRVDTYFSQNETLLVRAKAIDATCKRYGVYRLVAWGDSANQTDIVEINQRFIEIKSQVRVVPVGNENKLRVPGVAQLNTLLDESRFYSRKPKAAAAGRQPDAPMGDMHWWLGKNAQSDGAEMAEESRWQWEALHWSFPVPKPGEAQTDDPDDNSADGGDCMAATRYGVMSHTRPKREQAAPARTHEAQHPGFNQQDPLGRAVARDAVAHRALSTADSKHAHVTRFNTPRR